MTAVYQCVKNGEHWHLTQEQSVPPPAHRGGAYTSCSKWAEFKLGYEKRRPTCPECAMHVFAYEKKLRGTAFDWIDQIGEPSRDGAADDGPAPECPECESADTEDSGYSTLEYRCRSCGYRWEPK